ncbi:MAG: SemiSWEET transporter [Parcubacteria group bacterium]|nr:SemiSWEET transporter [Parcubacteria group bacterium]
MELVTLIGFLAGTFTTISFLPQVIKIWKTKETKSISLLMYVSFTVGVALWLCYGILLNEAPLYVVNGVTLVLTSSVLFLKIKYG